MTDGAVTFLDVDADRYLGLPAGCQKAFLHLVEFGAVGDLQISELAPLAEAGLLVASQHLHMFPTPVTVPEARQSALDTIESRVSPWKFLSAWYCQLKAKHDLKRHPLRQVLASVYNKKADAGDITSPPPPSALMSFLTTSMVSQNHDQCLPRSLAMVDFLAMNGCFPLFVIGVKTNPFEAHAWVQFNDMILNDDVEKVSRFTPILAI